MREQIRAVLREQLLNEEIERWTEELRRDADVVDLLDPDPQPSPPSSSPSRKSDSRKPRAPAPGLETQDEDSLVQENDQDAKTHLTEQSRGPRRALVGVPHRRLVGRAGRLSQRGGAAAPPRPTPRPKGSVFPVDESWLCVSLAKSLVDRPGEGVAGFEAVLEEGGEAHRAGEGVAGEDLVQLGLPRRLTTISESTRR